MNQLAARLPNSTRLDVVVTVDGRLLLCCCRSTTLRFDDCDGRLQLVHSPCVRAAAAVDSSLARRRLWLV